MNLQRLEYDITHLLEVMESEKYLSRFVSFGKRLKELRKSKELTLLDLEVMTGINNGD